MPYLSPVEGVAAGRLDVVVVRSVTAAMRELLKPGVRAVTSAGDFGAWNVWIRDDRRYRCEFYRWCVTQDGQTFTTKKDVRAWLKEWAPQVHEEV